MRPSRNDLYARIDALTTDLADAQKGELACAKQVERVASELSRAKDVIASHLVHVGHPSTVLHDVHAFATALQQALTDAGVDLRAELALMEGADL